MVSSYASLGISYKAYLLRGMAAAIVEDRERRCVEDASDFFERITEYNTPSLPLRDRDDNNNLKGPDVERIGKSWYESFLMAVPRFKFFVS